MIIKIDAARIPAQAIVAAATLLFSPSFAVAQKKDRPKGEESVKDEEKEKKEAARAHFKKGVELYKNEEYGKALDSFLASNQLFPHPKTVLNIANCYEKLYDLPQAMLHFEQYLEEAGADVTADEKKEIQAKLQRMGEKVARLQVKGGTAGEIIVDGVRVAEVPLKRQLYLSAGMHSVVIKSGGKVIFSEDVVLHGGGGAVIDLDTKKVQPIGRLVEAKAAPEEERREIKKGDAEVKAEVEDVAREAATKGIREAKSPEKPEVKTEAEEHDKPETTGTAEGRGTLHIFTNVDGAEVLINDKSVGKTPWGQDLKPGVYNLKVSYPGLPSWERIVEVKPDKTSVVDVDMTATKKKLAPWWMITAGGTALFAALWIGFGASGLDAKSNAEANDPRKCKDQQNTPGDPPCTTPFEGGQERIDYYNNLVEKARRNFIVTYVTAPLAALCAGGTVALLLLGKTEKRVPKANIKISSITPFATQDGSGGGLSVTGSF